MEKGLIIRDICQKLLDDKKDEGRQIANEKYSFGSNMTEKRNYTPFQQTKIFLRDGFIDRYSGEKLLFPGIFRILKRELPDVFPAHLNWKMTETHLVYWELFPTIDHIYPIARGGMDKDENMITTSMLKNSAKSNWTLDEIGWTIKKPGLLTEWDGLVNIFLELVKKNNSLLADSYIKKWHGALYRALKEKSTSPNIL
jgi:5-methylcytosine-specific restriction endonuclease McrA